MAGSRGEPRQRATSAARLGFAAVVLAAGISGLALLAFPGSAGDYFSWDLGPPPLAGLIGGLYVASAVTFGTAVLLPWPQVRSLVTASLVLTAPTFAATLNHLELFDLARWQAWFWIILFGGAPLFWAGLLLAHRSSHAGVATTGNRPISIAFLVVSVALAAIAVIVWIDPISGSRPLPFDFSPLGGRFAGSWLAFLAVMAGWVALRPAEARLPLISLVAYSGGALVAGIRSMSDLAPSPAAKYGYLAALAGAFVLFLAAARAGARGAGSPTGGRGW